MTVKLTYVVLKNDRRCVVWSALLLYVAMSYAAVIVPTEGLCYFLTGEVSRAVLLIGVMGVSLYVVRAVARSLSAPKNQLPVVS
jgi:hypothetical protein